MSIQFVKSLFFCLAVLSPYGLAYSQISSEEIFKSIDRENISSSPAIFWQQFGPGMSGNTKAAFWHPYDPNVLYISPNMGNSYCSIDKGHTYQTILDADGASIKTGLRGPREILDIGFSKQDPNFGWCTDRGMAGLFVTHDKGATWQLYAPKDNAFAGIFLSCIESDPFNPDVWYLGTGRIRDVARILFTEKQPHGVFTDKNSMGKIWKSTDAGKSWLLCNKGIDARAEIESILVDPRNSQVVYASTTYGFYKSMDGGKSWSPKNKGLDHGVLRSFDYNYDAKNKKLTFYVIDNTAWHIAGSSIENHGGGIFKSTDGGDSWTNVTDNLNIDMQQLASDYSLKKSYYNVLSYYFDIPAKEAQKQFKVLPTKILQRFNAIEVDPTDADNVYITNDYSNGSRNTFMPAQMWRSKDGGKNWYVCFRNGKNWEDGKDVKYWVERGNPMHNNVSLRYLKAWMNRDPYERKACNYIKFNCDGTVLHTEMDKISLMSYDKGDTWVDIDDEYVEPGTENYVGAGNSNLPGHGFYQDIRFPNTIFCMAGENSLWTTNEGGEKVRPGAQAATAHKFFPTEQSLSTYAIHPQDKNIRFALFFRQDAKGKLLRSTDGGKSWKIHGTAISNWETKPHAGDQSVHQLHLTINPDNPDNMYFCVPKRSKDREFVGNSVSGFGVHASYDGGKTWTESNVGLPRPYDIIAIKLDPANTNIIYACAQGRNGGLFKSENNGRSWSSIPSTESISGQWGINDIHFAQNGYVYITAGDKNAEKGAGGLWVSKDKMKTWTRLFNYPNTFRVETARYDPNIIMLSTQTNKNINFMNAGIYISKDGGTTWVKANRGCGQSDRVNDIAIDYTVPGRYYISTYGSGWYVASETN